MSISRNSSEEILKKLKETENEATSKGASFTYGDIEIGEGANNFKVSIGNGTKFNSGSSIKIGNISIGSSRVYKTGGANITGSTQAPNANQSINLMNGITIPAGTNFQLGNIHVTNQVEADRVNEEINKQISNTLSRSPK